MEIDEKILVDILKCIRDSNSSEENAMGWDEFRNRFPQIEEGKLYEHAQHAYRESLIVADIHRRKLWDQVYPGGIIVGLTDQGNDYIRAARWRWMKKYLSVERLWWSTITALITTIMAWVFLK